LKKAVKKRDEVITRMEKVVRQFTDEKDHIIEIDSDEEIDLQLLGVDYVEAAISAEN
jgi:hypothetical protein